MFPEYFVQLCAGSTSPTSQDKHFASINLSFAIARLRPSTLSQTPGEPTPRPPFCVALLASATSRRENAGCADFGQGQREKLLRLHHLGRRQEQPTLPTAQLAGGSRDRLREEERKGAAPGAPTCLSLLRQRSAGCSSRNQGCAEELTLPMHLSVCFGATRLTLTQSSWTALSPGRSRKWMSGYAARALVAPSDRRPRINFNRAALREPIPSSEGESPFPLDLYLSWMSRFSPVSLRILPRSV